MLERDYIDAFESVGIRQAEKITGAKELRVYAYEFPVSYQGQDGRIDMVLEDVRGDLFDRSNPIIAVEFKGHDVSHGPVDQLNLYLKTLGKKLYRPNVSGWIVAPSFSVHEIEEAKKSGVRCLVIDTQGNVKFVRQ